MVDTSVIKRSVDERSKVARNKEGFYSLLNNAVSKGGGASSDPAHDHPHPNKEEPFNFFRIIKSARLESKAHYDIRTPHRQALVQAFHLSVNAYTLNMIVAALMLLLSSITYVAYWELEGTTPIFILFHLICIGDVVGSFLGVLSLVPYYTFGGWGLCNWIIRKWNAKHGKTKAPLSQPTSKGPPPHNNLNKSKGGSGKSPRGPPAPAPHKTKGPPASAQQGKGARKGPPPGRTAEQRNPRMENKRGCFWRRRFIPCKLCTSGISVKIQHLNSTFAFASCCIIHVSGFLGLISTAFRRYSTFFVSHFDKCKLDGTPKICSEYESMFKSLLLLSWISIGTRTLVLTAIGWHLDGRTLETLRPLKEAPPQQSPYTFDELHGLQAKPAGGWDEEAGQSKDPQLKKKKKKKKKENKKRRDGSSSSSSSGDSGGEYKTSEAIKLYYKYEEKEGLLETGPLSNLAPTHHHAPPSLLTFANRGGGAAGATGRAPRPPTQPPLPKKTFQFKN